MSCWGMVEYFTCYYIQISGAVTNSDMVVAVNKEDAATVILEAGFSKPLTTVQLSDKADIISLLTTYHLFIKPKAVMDQYKAGLTLFGLSRFIEKYPNLIRPLFVDEHISVTASKCYCVILTPYLTLHACFFYRPAEEYVICTLLYGRL